MADTTQLGEQIGSVISSTGSVWAVSGTSQRALSDGAPVYEGEEIITESDSNVEIKFADDTILGQGEDSAVRLDDYMYSGDEGQLDFSMIKGVMRVVSGEIVKINPEAFNLSTPLATIGIRGTQVMVQVDEGREFIGVDEMGEGHHVIISNAFGEVIIDKPGMFSGVDFDGSLIAPDEMPESFIHSITRAAPLTILGDSPRVPGESQEVTPPEFFETIDNQTGEYQPGVGMEYEEDEEGGEEEYEEVELAEEEIELTEAEIEALLELETAAGTEGTGTGEEMGEVVDINYDPFSNETDSNEGEGGTGTGTGTGGDETAGGGDDTPPEDLPPDVPPEDAPPADEPEPELVADNAETQQDATEENAPVSYNVIEEGNVEGEGAVLVDAEVVDGTDEDQEKLTIEEDGTIIYTPEEGEDGSVDIAYTVEDEFGQTETAELTIELTDDSEPDAEMASVDQETLGETVIYDAVSSEDVNFYEDGPGTLVSAGLVGTYDGELVVNTDDGKISYIPAENEIGEVTVTYTVEDSDHDEVTNTLTINLADPPELVAGVGEYVQSDTAENTDAVYNINEEVSGQGVTLVSATVIDGTPEDQLKLSVDDEGNITYTPAPGEDGTVDITYTVTDDFGQTDTGTLTMTLADDSTPDVLQASAVDQTELGDTVVFDAAGSQDINIHEDGPATLIEASLDGTYSGTLVTNLEEGTISYKPGANEIGEVLVNYTVQDSDGDEVSNALTINLAAPPELVVEDNDAIVQLAQDENDSVSFDVIADGDVDGQGARLVSAAVDGDHPGTLYLEDNTFTYVPGEGEDGNVNVTYTVVDDFGQTDTGTLTVTLAEDSTPEIMQASVLNQDELGDTVVFNTARSSDIDFSEDGPGTLMSATLSGTYAGTLTSNLADGTISYEPGLNEIGEVLVNYTVQDSDGDEVTNTLTINLAPPPELVAGDGEYVQPDAAENSDAVYNINDDVSGQGVSLVSAAVVDGTAEDQLKLSVDSSGNITYNPAEGEDGIVNITYTVTDDFGQTTTGGLTVTLADDSEPTATDAFEIQAESNDAVTYNVFDEDNSDNTGLDGGTLVNAELADGSTATGTVGFNADGTITYTPTEEGEMGTVLIDYTVEDDDGDTATAQYTIDLNAAAGGSFSNDDITAPVGSGWIAAFDTSVDGWEAPDLYYETDGEKPTNYRPGGDASMIEVWKAGFNGVLNADGGTDGFFIELDYAGATDSIYQTMATEVGEGYSLSFDATIRPDANNANEVVIVQVWDGDTLIEEQTITPNQYDRDTDEGWNRETLDFTAQSENTKIVFTEPDSGDPGNTHNTYGVLLDNIALTENPDYSVVENFSGRDNATVVIGTSDADAIAGEQQMQDIFGLGGNDTLSGGNSKDYIVGGEGDDALSGGSGQDTFVFTSPEDGTDTIMDFKSVNDQIQLYQSTFTLSIDNSDGSVADDQFAVIDAESFSGDYYGDGSSGLIYASPTPGGTGDSNIGNLYYDPVGADDPAVHLATIYETHGDLNANDIDIKPDADDIDIPPIAVDEIA